ncbi:hypothetical protein Tco_0231764 [Tanacetum coccineum]
MDTTRAQQQALDDELVALADHALKLTPFYNAFEISADVPEIYMQEFGVTISRHHSLLCFKLNGKSHTVNVDNFRDMLKICPKLHGQIFEEPPLEEEILSFIRDLGHTGEIKFLSDVNINHMHQSLRSFAAIINKCLSGKTIALEILWGMYHNKTIDYVYLLWEDLVYQVENKNSKKNNDMYYPRFTKVIIDYFMAKDQEIPRRKKMFWHYVRDDFMFTTIRVISKHQDTQVYGAILPQHLTNHAMLESKAYMTYHAYATGEKTPKLKSTKKKVDYESSPKTKLTQASKGKRIKTVAKGDKPAKKKQSVTKSKGLTMLSEVALTEAEQIKLATKRSLIQTHSSHASGSGADEGTGSIPGVLDVPTYESDDEQISWKSSEEDDDDEVNVSEDNDDDADNDDDVDNEDEDDDAGNQDDEIPDDANQDDDDEQTDSDNDGDDFVHPKLSTHDDEARQNDEVNEEESDEEVQGENIKEEEIDEEATHEEDEANELYRDVNINLEGRDTVMTDAPLPNVQGTQISGPPLLAGEPPLLSATTLPPTPLITHLQQTPVPSPATVPNSSLQDLPNFGSLFGFNHRLKTLETDFLEFKQTNQFAEAVSSIPGIVDAYLSNKIHEAVKTAIQLQSERLRDKAQAENADFINKLDDNIKKIIKDQVKEQVKAQLILDTYGDTVSFKRRRDDEDKDEEPSAGSHRGSKRTRAGKEPESTNAPKEKTSKTYGKSYEGSKSKHKTAGESAQNRGAYAQYQRFRRTRTSGV